MNRLTISVKEASRIADRHPATIRRWVKGGQLEGAIRHNGGWVSRASLEKLTGTKIELPDDDEESTR